MDENPFSQRIRIPITGYYQPKFSKLPPSWSVFFGVRMLGKIYSAQKWNLFFYKNMSPFLEISILNFKKAVTSCLSTSSRQVWKLSNLFFGYLLIRENPDVLSSQETEIYKVNLSKAFDDIIFSLFL